MNNVTVTNRKTGEVETFTEAEYTEKRNALLQVWQTAKERLEHAKAEELEFRNAAVDFMADPEKVGKTQTVDLGNGYKAKIKIPEKYTFVKQVGQVPFGKGSFQNRKGRRRGRTYSRAFGKMDS